MVSWVSPVGVLAQLTQTGSEPVETYTKGTQMIANPNTTAIALDRVLSTEDPEDLHRSVNVADGLFAIAQSIDGLTRAVRFLGNGDAATHHGAIEAMSMQLKEGLDTIGGEVGRGLSLIAQAVELNDSGSRAKCASSS